jgi:UDP-glucose 4-epimerase
MYTLILGGNSYIARFLRKTFSKHSIPTIVFCRTTPKHTYNNEQLIIGDINEHKKLRYCFEKKISSVFQFIYSGNPRSSSNPEHFNYVNYLLSLVCENNVGSYVLPSSGSVYGNNNVANKETFNTNPISQYAIDKKKEEDVTLNSLKKTKANPIVLRIGNVYGPNYSKLNTQGVIPTILNNLHHNKPINIWGDGNIRRDYIFIDDLVNLLVKIKNYKTTNVFNVGAGTSFSVNELINNCFKLTEKTVPVNYLTGHNEDIVINALDVGKINKLINWHTTVNIEEGIIECWNKTIFS